MGSSLPCPFPTVSTLLIPQGPGQNPSLSHPLLPSLSAWSQPATSGPVCLTPASLSLAPPHPQPSHPPGSAESQGVMGANSQETRAPVIRAGQCPGRYIPAFLEALRGSLGRRASGDRAPHSGAGGHAGQGSPQWLESLHCGLGDHPGGSPMGAATVELRGRSLRRPLNKGKLRRLKEVKSVLPLMIEGRTVFAFPHLSPPHKLLLFLAPGCQQQQTKINHSPACLDPDMPTV